MKLVFPKIYNLWRENNLMKIERTKNASRI